MRSKKQISKHTISRRKFTRLAAGLTASAGAAFRSPVVIGAAKPRVAVIGGGVAGAIVARRLAAAGDVSVTLIERNTSYTSCFFGSHYLAGYRSIDSLTFSYHALAKVGGLELINGSVSSVDTERKRVRISDGGEIFYDRAVFATGIGFRFEAVEGYDAQTASIMPHAYANGADIQLLRSQLESMADGGLVVIGAPPHPYRCPPAPYERATLIANYLKRNKPRSKVLILDAKNGFPLQTLFERAWQRFYPDMIEWLPAEMTGGITGVEPERMVVRTDFEDIEANVASIIPPQRAGPLERNADLVDETGWCPVNPKNLASTRIPGVYVIGDATSLGKLPKTATAAKSQAEICAAAIRAELHAGKIENENFENACYMLLAEQHAIRLEDRYRMHSGSMERQSIQVSEEDESDAVRAQTANAGSEWFTSMTRDMFG